MQVDYALTLSSFPTNESMIRWTVPQVTA